MSGCTYKRKWPSGRITWTYAVDAGKDENGKRRQIFKGGFATKREADDALRRLLNEKDVDPGALVKPDPQAYAAFLQEWFREHAERNCTPKTVERYRQLAAYILPHIGSTHLQGLTALGLERVLNKLKDSGGWNRKAKAPRPLAAKTIRHIASLVHASLDTAIRWKLINVNPMAGVILPKVAKREAKVLDHQQLGAYVAAARTAGVYEFTMLAIASGCRRGELLALQWSDIDFNARVVRISKSLEQTKAGLRIKPTKTEKPRELPLPDYAIEVLRAQRAVQSENRRLFERDYRDDLNLVFATLDGQYLKPDSMTAKVCLITKKAGLKGIGIHTLRHSFGSHLLSEGVPLATVSKLLGHSDVYTTAKIYSHSLTEDEKRVSAVLDRIASKAKLS
jgi:integrase